MADGGETRFHSVANGLAEVPDGETDALVAVHDGVRPFVSREVIAACYESAFPQTFRADVLKAAYRQEYRPFFTDDASVVEAMGVPVSLVPGNRENIKITTPFDLKIAEALLSD